MGSTPGKCETLQRYTPYMSIEVYHCEPFEVNRRETMRMQFDEQKKLWYTLVNGYTYWAETNEALISLVWELSNKNI